MTPHCHSIAEVDFNFAFNTPDQVMNEAAELPQFIKTRLVPCMDNVMATWKNNDETIRIEHLTIDLGNVTYNDMEAVLARKLRQALLEAIPYPGLEKSTHLPIRSQRLSREQVQLDLISRYLTTGILPWNAEKYTQSDLTRILENLLRVSPRTLIAFVQGQSNENNPVLSRLVRQFQPGLLRRFIQTVAPDTAERICQWITLLCHLNPDKTLLPLSRSQWICYVWETALRRLLRSGGPSEIPPDIKLISPSDLAAAVVKQAADHCHIAIDEIHRRLTAKRDHNAQTLDRGIPKAVDRLIETMFAHQHLAVTPESDLDTWPALRLRWLSALENHRTADFDRTWEIMRTRYPDQTRHLIETFAQHPLQQPKIVGLYSSQQFNELIALLESQDVDCISDAMEHVIAYLKPLSSPSTPKPDNCFINDIIAPNHLSIPPESHIDTWAVLRSRWLGAIENHRTADFDRTWEIMRTRYSDQTRYLIWTFARHPLQQSKLVGLYSSQQLDELIELLDSQNNVFISDALKHLTDCSKLPESTYESMDDPTHDDPWAINEPPKRATLAHLIAHGADHFDDTRYLMDMIRRQTKERNIPFEIQLSELIQTHPLRMLRLFQTLSPAYQTGIIHLWARFHGSLLKQSAHSCLQSESGSTHAHHNPALQSISQEASPLHDWVRKLCDLVFNPPQATPCLKNEPGLQSSQQLANPPEKANAINVNFFIATLPFKISQEDLLTEIKGMALRQSAWARILPLPQRTLTNCAKPADDLADIIRHLLTQVRPIALNAFVRCLNHAIESRRKATSCFEGADAQTQIEVPLMNSGEAKTDKTRPEILLKNFTPLTRALISECQKPNDENRASHYGISGKNALIQNRDQHRMLRPFASSGRTEQESTDIEWRAGSIKTLHSDSSDPTIAPKSCREGQAGALNCDHDERSQLMRSCEHTDGEITTERALETTPLKLSHATDQAYHESIESMYICNAGMVLVAPYLPRLFGKLDLLSKNGFKDRSAAERAIHLLEYIVHERSEAPEFKLPLNKVLCGLSSGIPLLRGIDISGTEQEIIQSLLQSLIRHWKIIGNTSLQGLRSSFLQRPGDLTLKEDAWHLKVHGRAYDMLLDHLPWSFATIKHPWMKRVLHVHWR